MTLKMTKEAQERMQERIGVLITGEIPEPYQILRQMLKGEKVIAIGDVVAENLIKAGIEPDMMVVDGKSMREEREIAVQCDITVKNRESEITEGYKRIYVEGEEDLAALPAILYAEENSVIVYGQPSEGIMVIRPTEENKETVRKTLELFEKLE